MRSNRQRPVHRSRRRSRSRSRTQRRSRSRSRRLSQSRNMRRSSSRRKMSRRERTNRRMRSPRRKRSRSRQRGGGLFLGRTADVAGRQLLESKEGQQALAFGAARQFVQEAQRKKEKMKQQALLKKEEMKQKALAFGASKMSELENQALSKAVETKLALHHHPPRNIIRTRPAGTKVH